MGYKDILVHLDASPRAEARLNLAAALAAAHKAYLTAIYVVDLPSPALFMGDTTIFDIRLADEILNQARERGNAVAGTAEQNFLTALRQNNIDGEWQVVERPAAEEVAIRARYADIVIVGQTDTDNPAAQDGRRIPEAVLLSGGRPVLVVPYIGTIDTVGQTVLVGWKSSREAARAINDAIPLLQKARSITVLSIDQDDSPATEVVRHLARHGIAAEAAHTPSGGLPEGDVLLNSASDLGADLIVVGGYGHSRASEFVFGGVTRTLLTEMTIPVLFSH
jgi:nucleotide-binding universal stress UspA family protein